MPSNTCASTRLPNPIWPREQSLGTLVNFPHLAAAPPGLTITVDVTPDKIDGRRLYFPAVAHDGVDHITEGKHERVVIDKAKFESRLTDKFRHPERAA
jgi:fluoroacetyl-CoA thioesterase